MSVKSVLDKIGQDVKDVFLFAASNKGEALVSDGEALVETFVPGSAGAITLFNNWLTEILKTQALATAAGAQAGSSDQKAALVLSAIGPQAVAFAKANGVSTPTAAQLNTVNSLLVSAFNILGADPAPIASEPVTQVAEKE